MFLTFPSVSRVQEGSAEKAADALKAMLSSDAEVIRDGKNVQIPAGEVVPGDIVVVNLGDRLPADIRMLDVFNMACSEAALTGESIPVEKIVSKIEAENPNQVPLGDRKNMAFSATMVSQGRCLGLVVATGDHTQIGNINALVNKVGEKKTNVQRQIDRVSTYIAVFVIICAVITFLVAFFVTGLNAVDSVSIALVCAVAMIPEGLASIVSLTYAWAVSKMAAMNAIVRALPAVETLGSVTVICSDKTGTLTKNEMTLAAFVTSNTRYKFNTDATDRDPSNFVRDDTFIAKRSEVNVTKDKSGKNTKISIHGGTGEINHHYGEERPDASSRSLTGYDVDSRDSDPVANGESPSMEYFRYVQSTTDGSPCFFTCISSITTNLEQQVCYGGWRLVLQQYLGHGRWSRGRDWKSNRIGHHESRLLCWR